MRVSRLAMLMLVLLAALLLAAGCGGDDDNGDSGSDGGSNGDDSGITTPAPLESGGAFRVCTDVPYPPAEYLEGTTFVGYEIDIMNEVADRLNTNAEYEKTLFDAIIPSLQAKKCDAIISSMNVTPEREKEVAFVRYMEIGQSLMVATDNDDDIANLDDLAGKTVAVQVGTTLKDALDAKSKELVADGEDAIEVQSFPDGGSAAAALKSDRVDVFFADSPVVADYINKDDSFKFAGEPIDPLPVGIALRTEDTELTEAIQDAVDAMYEDGGMDEILEKWKVADFGLPDA
ncbi:MAG: basic amino acid transporter substrate-binding protein [Thermoleophilia bacterium]|nr:basic amino acid transporter substrate-binding protein [Thermoleophilia bacterium]